MIIRDHMLIRATRVCWVQDPKTKRWSIKATIVKAINKRSFTVNDGFHEFIRNRKFLRLR